MPGQYKGHHYLAFTWKLGRMIEHMSLSPSNSIITSLQFNIATESANQMNRPTKVTRHLAEYHRKYWRFLREAILLLHEPEMNQNKVPLNQYKVPLTDFKIISIGIIARQENTDSKIKYLWDWSLTNLKSW